MGNLTVSLAVLFLSLACLSLSSSLSNHSQAYLVFVSDPEKRILFSSHHHWYSSILTSLPTSHHKPELLYTYNPFLSGFAAHITSDQADALSRFPGIISVIPDQIYYPQTTHTPHYLGLSSGYGIWPDGHYGEDMIIGVVDSGVWPEHPSYSDSGLTNIPAKWKGVCETSVDFPASSCNKKLIGARAFYKGASTHSISPRDKTGHGTHTSTTAAGSAVRNSIFYGYGRGVARGMAPKARIAAYKVCWRNNGCPGKDIVAAIGKAVEDGVDVLSCSLGLKGDMVGYHRDPLAIAAFSAVNRHGVPVVCSAGNKGPRPGTVRNAAPWLLTVGASTIDREFLAEVVIGDGQTFSAITLYTGKPLPDKMFPVTRATRNYACTRGSLLPNRVQGKIVFCEPGELSPLEKAKVVKSAGGVAMILRNSKDVNMIDYDAFLSPAATVSFSDGGKILQYIKDNDKKSTAKIVFRGTVTGDSPSSPKVASFSSRGPNKETPDLLKPDVIAPGVNILAGWTGHYAPTELPNGDKRVQFWIQSGTSMSCPHVSGIAALLKKAYPSWSPAAIRSALMTTAYTLDNSGKTIGDTSTGKPSTPFDYGAGHIDPNAALDPGLVYDTDQDEYIRFLCGLYYSDLHIIGVFLGRVPPADICNNRYDHPGGLNYPSTAVQLEYSFSRVPRKYTRKLKNVGSNANATYTVTVNPPPNITVKVSPSTLVFTEKNQVLSYDITIGNVRTLSSDENKQRFGSLEWSDGTHKVRSPIVIYYKYDYNVAST